MKRLKLRARIIERYGTLGAFAAKNGTNYQTISNVLTGKTTPKGLSLAGWLAVLEIPEDEVHIFFPECWENPTA